MAAVATIYWDPLHVTTNTFSSDFSLGNSPEDHFDWIPDVLIIFNKLLVVVFLHSSAPAQFN